MHHGSLRNGNDKRSKSWLWRISKSRCADIMRYRWIIRSRPNGGGPSSWAQKVTSLFDQIQSGRLPHRTITAPLGSAGEAGTFRMKRNHYELRAAQLRYIAAMLWRNSRGRPVNAPGGRTEASVHRRDRRSYLVSGRKGGHCGDRCGDYCRVRLVNLAHWF